MYFDQDTTEVEQFLIRRYIKSLENKCKINKKYEIALAKMKYIDEYNLGIYAANQVLYKYGSRRYYKFN